MKSDFVLISYNTIIVRLINILSTVLEVHGHKNDCPEIYRSEMNGDVKNSVNGFESGTTDDLLDQIPVPSLAPDERTINAINCNGSVSYTTAAPSELGAVPEEDEEAATSSTPSTVVCFLILNHYTDFNFFS